MPKYRGSKLYDAIHVVGESAEERSSWPKWAVEEWEALLAQCKALFPNFLWSEDKGMFEDGRSVMRGEWLVKEEGGGFVIPVPDDCFQDDYELVREDDLAVA